MAKEAQESRMAAGKVYYDATRQLAEGKIADAIAALESGLVSCATRRKFTTHTRSGVFSLSRLSLTGAHLAGTGS